MQNFTVSPDPGKRCAEGVRNDTKDRDATD